MGEGTVNDEELVEVIAVWMRHRYDSREQAVSDARDFLAALRSAGFQVIDDHDRALYSESFVLADAVRRVLTRRSTQKVIDGGFLDDDVVAPLVESADRMWSIRTQRVGAARSDSGGSG